MEGHPTEKIKIRHGVRQGCPLSPALIFNIALEPFAVAITTDRAFEGIQCQRDVAKIGLYVDDVVCYLGHPLASVKVLDQLTGKFDLVSRYKVDQEKIILFGFNVTE